MSLIDIPFLQKIKEWKIFYKLKKKKLDKSARNDTWEGL